MKKNQHITDTRNSSSIRNARIGRWKGIESLFTHRNPQNGDLYGEDIPDVKDENGYLMKGKWVPADQVEFIDVGAPA